jgi:hypothetical protein
MEDKLGITGRRLAAIAAPGVACRYALASLLRGVPRSRPHAPDALVPRKPHHPKAKSIIWLFMEAARPHLTCSIQAQAAGLAGQPMPSSFSRHYRHGYLEQYAHAEQAYVQTVRQSGIWVSDWYPNIAERRRHDRRPLGDRWAESPKTCQMNTTVLAAAGHGKWTTRLGSANRNLPSFVILLDDKEPVGGPKNWISGFSATYQGTQFRQGDTPILHLRPPQGTTDEEQRGKLDFLKRLNERFSRENPGDTELEARIGAYELAYQMQSAAPEAVDFSKESDATKKMYGVDEPDTAAFGANCLLARRLVERGVRFVELYAGSGSGWDAHTDLEKNHSRHCRASDKPIAGLLADLKSRGLLDETLVVWGGEFGRTPFNEKGDGRDHNPWGFTMWMAGGGIKGGQYVGSTDEIGLRATERPVHVHDIHASILWLLGLDHVGLTYMHNGRAERPTEVYGHVIHELFA